MRLSPLMLCAAVAAMILAVPATIQAQSPSAKKTPASPATTKPATPPKPAGLQGAVGAAAPLPRVYAPTRPREVAPKYPWRKNIPTTIFWIGEVPTENNPTPNHASSWDTKWQLNYGGFDNPARESRTWDFRPKAFTPGLNPFYVALPFNDLIHPNIARQIPWYKKKKEAGAKSVCQSVWVAIRLGNKTCFAQWEDCGPFNTDDVEYVFGGKPPKTTGNGGAGLDVSPAVRDFLGITSGALCDWRFCEDHEVPDGPWSRYGKNNTFLRQEQRESEAMKRQYADLVRRREEWLSQQQTRAKGPAAATPPRAP